MGRFDNIHPGLTCEHARAILATPLRELESSSDLYTAAAHLINCSEPETHSVLIELIENPSDDQPVRIAKRKGVEVLARLGCREAIQAIGQCLWSDDQYLVENAVWSLQQLNCQDPILIDRMLDLLRDQDLNQRVLIQCLASLGVKQSLGVIVALQDAEAPGVKSSALSAVAQLSGDSSRLPEIVDHLSLPNQMDRQSAIQDLIDAHAIKFLPEIVKAPVSPVFRMRACRKLMAHQKSEDFDAEFLSMVDAVLKDDPSSIHVVHHYDQLPDPEFLVGDLFHTDFSRCYLAMQSLHSFRAEMLAPLLTEAWTQKAENDYGAHYLFLRLLGSRLDWPDSSVDWICQTVFSSIRNRRPQFQKSRAMAILAYHKLCPEVFLDHAHEFLDSAMSPPWDCRYMTVLCVENLDSIEINRRIDFLAPFLDDQDAFVRERASLGRLRLMSKCSD